MNEGFLPYLARLVEYGQALLTTALEAAEVGAGLSIDLLGCGYAGPYPAAAQGDPTAIVVRDAINGFLQHLLGPPPTPASCFLCTEPLHTVARDTGIIVAAYPAVAMPSSVCCAAICTECAAALPDYGDLTHAIMQRYRAWLPDLHLVPMAEAGHA